MKLDLNCDLGEGEPAARTRALMRAITSANIACGGHAGTVASMESCVRLATSQGVRVGAHPGPPPRGAFGRAPVTITAEDLELLLLQQVGALACVARAHGAQLHHVKLHGALYHAVEANPVLARRYVNAVARWWPRCVIYARSGGRVAQAAARRSTTPLVRVWEEAFADRGYRDDGTLVPRGQTGDLLKTTAEAVERARSLATLGIIRSVTGRLLPIRARTICVHSDTPHAPATVQALARVISDE